MDPSKKLSTPHWPAEQRAWLLVYSRRLGMGRQLKEAFVRQFPDRQYSNIGRHVAHVSNEDESVQSQLLELAKQYPWYEAPPQEGETGYKYMKRMENMQEARKRMKSRHPRTRKDTKI